jgi:hypothetical protein
MEKTFITVGKYRVNLSHVAYVVTGPGGIHIVTIASTKDGGAWGFTVKDPAAVAAIQRELDKFTLLNAG